jgi:hypothetical protein
MVSGNKLFFAQHRAANNREGRILIMSLHSKDELNRLYNLSYVHDVMRNDYGAGIALAHAFRDCFPNVTRLADVGCNNGVHMKEMLNIGFEIEGYDISSAALKNAIVSQDLIHLVDLREPMDEHLRFDLAYAIECVEHIEYEALPQFIDNMKTFAPIFICTPGNQAGTGHFIAQPETWWIYQFVQRGWDYDIRQSAELHDYLMNTKWDSSLKRFPFPRKGIMVFRND